MPICSWQLARMNKSMTNWGHSTSRSKREFVSYKLPMKIEGPSTNLTPMMRSFLRLMKTKCASSWLQKTTQRQRKVSLLTSKRSQSSCRPSSNNSRTVRKTSTSSMIRLGAGLNVSSTKCLSSSTERPFQLRIAQSARFSERFPSLPNSRSARLRNASTTTTTRTHSQTKTIWETSLPKNML